MNLSETHIAALQVSTNGLVNWLLQKKSELLNNEPEYVIGMFGAQIARATALYPQASHTIELSIPLFKIPQDKKHESVQRMAAGCKKLNKDILDAVVFSSAATFEVIPHWSDLDVLVIVRDEVFTAPQRLAFLRSELLKLEECLYEFDQWQHHGLQFITEADLHFYPESFLPLTALKEAASLIEARTLSLAVRESRTEQLNYFLNVVRTLVAAEAEEVLRHHSKDGVFLLNNYANRDNAFYQLKYFISVVLLLPSLFLGLVEKPIAKKESFIRIKEYFSPSELEFLTACENVRLLFMKVRPRENEIPREVEPILGKNYFEQAAHFAVRLKAAYESHQPTSNSG